MVCARMLAIALRLAWPNLLMPWRSPLVRWRLETFGVTDDAGRLLHADAIGPAVFFRYMQRERTALRRFLRWAATL